MGILDKLKFNKKNNDVVNDAVTEAVQIDKYEKAMNVSRDSFTKKIRKIASKNREVNEEYFKDLEEVLIMSDVGVVYTQELIKHLKNESRMNNITDAKLLTELIFDEMFTSYLDDNTQVEINISEGLNVILVIGVNGVGKTTSIGKLIKHFKDEGKTVEIAAADTFRAGAVEQLSIWADRTNVEIEKPIKEFEDPGAVVFRAIEKAKANNTDILIVDTAGRLENKDNLMKELEKINKIILTSTGKDPSETLLVLDSTTGQSGINQATAFNEVTTITGIVLTKMDSSAKGGIILTIKTLLDIPVKFIGVGESIEDIEKFDLDKYLWGLLREDDE